MSFFDTLLWPIMVAVAWTMVQFHSFFTWLGLGSDSGNSWVLSIVGLVIVMRIILIPLFVKQIKASRGLQLIQPEVQKLQKKYKGKTDPASRQAMQKEMMQLYRDAGTNPFASCLPILAQSPIFFALFRVLYTLPDIAAGTYPNRTSIGPLTAELAASAESSTFLGAPLSSTFIRAGEFGDMATNVRIVTVILIILMSATTFTTQRQLTMKNMPAAALDNPMARQQRMLMYILPGVFAVSGVNFPIGVLIYWFTTNLWSMGQQFYVIRNMPAPGSEAEAALQARRARKAARKGLPLPEDEPQDTPEDKQAGGQRQQPVRKDRKKPSRPPGSTGGQASDRQGQGGKQGQSKQGQGKQGQGGQGQSGKSSGQRKPPTASGQTPRQSQPKGGSGSGKQGGRPAQGRPPQSKPGQSGPRPKPKPKPRPESGGGGADPAT